MAKVYLDSGDTFALSGAASVFGSTGTEKVIVNTGVTGVVVDANVERVDLPGASSAFTFKQAGNQLQVFSGSTVVATIPLQDDANGTQIVFSNGSVDAKLVAGTPLTITLGGVTVPSAAAAAVTPTTIDATVTSGSGSSTGGTTTTGQAFTLTSSTTGDIPTLTAGSDTITGASGTLTTGDVLADGSTTDSDTLNAIINGAATTNKPVISNVEKINLDFKGFGVVFDAASTTNGTITVSSTQDGNTTATLNNVGSTVKVAVGSGISTLNLASSATTINLSGGQSVTLNNNATAGTLALVSTGSSANTVTYDAATSNKALAVSGSQNLTIKTADLSDFAGNTVANTLSGGATLTLESTGSAATADLSKVAVSTFNVNAAAAHNLTLASGANVTLSKDFAGGTLALASDGANDTLNLKVSESQTGTVALTNFETINLSVGTSTPLSVGTLAVATASNANTINLTGSQNVTLTTLTASATGTTLNAADFGAKLTATIGTNAATVIGGSSNDTIVGGTAADLVVGGAGADILNAGGTNGGTVADTVIGGAGNDVILLGGANSASSASTAVLTISSSALINGGDGTDTLRFTTTSATTLTGKVVSVENVLVDATVGAVTWTLADSDLNAGSTLVFELAAGTATGVLALNGAAETDASLNIKITNNAANVVTGGALADSITLLGNSAANTITAGKGVDTITLSAGATATLKFAAGDSGITAATADVVVGAGTDEVLQFTSVTATALSSALVTSTQLGSGWSVSTAGLATKTNATLDDFITAATAAGKAGSTGANGQAVAFVSGADTYVFYAGTDTAVNTDDGLVKLSGVVTNFASLSGSSFVLA